jgi:hypothetical protein
MAAPSNHPAQNASLVTMTPPPPQFRQIISCYEYSGCFSNSSEATTIFNCLLDSFEPGTKPAMLKSALKLGSVRHQPSEIGDQVPRTMIATTYIKKAYPTFDGVWELITCKAEAWVDSFFNAAAVRSELEGICVANWIGSEVHEDESLKVEADSLWGTSNYPSLLHADSPPLPQYQHDTSKSLNVAARLESSQGLESYSAPRPESHPESHTKKRRIIQSALSPRSQKLPPTQFHSPTYIEPPPI